MTSTVDNITNSSMDTSILETVADQTLERADLVDSISPSQAAAQEVFLTVVRELIGAYQAFTTYSDAYVRQTGLTPAQFDVIATLGNTPGLTMHHLANRTLVTKGTLTGIVDRLEQKGLVRREVPPGNRRCFMIQLTPAGQAVFESVYPAQVAHLKARFNQLNDSDLQQLQTSLEQLRLLFQPLA